MPFTGMTAGTRCATLPVSRQASQLVQEATDCYRLVLNTCIILARDGNLSAMGTPTDPIAVAAFKHYHGHRAAARGRVRVRSARSAPSVPAVGPLRPVLEAAVAVAGLSPTEVVSACFRLNPDRKTFALRVVLHGQPQPKVSTDQLLADHPRPSYAPDLGCAIMPDGLHISEMTIRDAMGSTEFRTGKTPTRYRIPLAEVLDPAFPKKFREMLLSMRVKPRTLTLDVSFLPNISNDVKRAISRLNRCFRRHLAAGAVAYRKTSSVGEENLKTRDNWKATGLLNGWELRHILTRAPMECPNCGAYISLKADPQTGAPLRSLERCACRHRPVMVGHLLADRARVRGVHGWLENLSGPRVTVTDKDLRLEAKHVEDAALAVEKGRKAVRDSSPVTRPNKATKTNVVMRNATKSSRPSQDYSAPRQGMARAIHPTHTTAGLVRRVSRKDLLARRSATYLAESLRLKQLANIESLAESLTFIDT
jgi:hypothetical protein